MPDAALLSSEAVVSKRKSVIIIRERNGNSVPAAFPSEGAAVNWIKSRIQPGTIVNADEAAGWDSLNARFEMRRINHKEAYSADGACTNMAEEFFSRLRRAEIGRYHHIAGTYLLRARSIMAGRQSRVANREQTQRVAHLAMTAKLSVDFSGYRQRHVKAA